jgi:proteasome lid subunit RPN8/RPN11
MTIPGGPTGRATGPGRWGGTGERRRVCHVAELLDPAPVSLIKLDGADTSLLRGGPGERPPAVVLNPLAYQALAEHSFSPQIEEGGFLIGHRHVIPGHLERDVLEVTVAVPAQCPDASPSRLTFPGESFLRLSNLLARRGRRELLLGWYHTHLFRASPDLGLSDVDVRFHQAVFQRPWQIAALVNLHASGRVLRIYQRTGDALVEVPFQARSLAC